MLIYQNSSKGFIQDIRENRLTEIMSQSFLLRAGRQVGSSEMNSWQNSLTRVRDLLELAELDDNMIALEYECPYNQSRIDCLLFGKDTAANENVVLVELKQWTSVIAQEDEGIFEENYKVETYTGARNRLVAHPSEQVKGYQNYLKSFITAFEATPPLTLFSCSYCHNYIKNDADGLFNPVYQEIVKEFPIYSRADTKALADKIKSLLTAGDGFEIFNRFMRSPIRPSKKLLENVSNIIQNEAVFSLLNEQLVAKRMIWAKIKKYQKNREKSIIIVHGGPGTGKSVIAINVLAEAARQDMKVFYGCKSKPFINGLQYLVGSKGEILFSNLYRFLPSKVKEDELDLLLIDEAHRVEKNSNFQYTKLQDRTNMPQIDQLIRCAKTVVFFIDDKQNVRSQEIGSSALIHEAARQYELPVYEVTLETQYRCMGSNDYLLWLESTLGYTAGKRILSKTEIFDFRIFDSPTEMYSILKIREGEKPNSARIVAGFCWPWSNPRKDGQLVNDVVIDDFAMPWEAKEGFKVAKGIPKWYEWGYKTGGINQVGCIYTVQGFEYDYIGVIIGDDLVFDPATSALTANIKATCDPTLKKYAANFESHVKNIYRALLTRGLKGCYVHFTNKETEKYFRSRMETENQ